MANSIEKEKAKEISRKKRNNFIKRVKKIINLIKKPFINLIEGFKSLNKDVKIIMGVWGIIILIIILLSLLVASSNSNREKYYNLEEAMDKATLSYVTDMKIYPSKEHKEIIPMQSLLLDGSLYEEDVLDESCTGYSVVYYDDENSKHIVESYISCDKYTTKFYNDYLEQ